MKLKKGDPIKVEIKTRKARKDGRPSHLVFVLTKHPQPPASGLSFQGIEIIYEKTQRKKPAPKVEILCLVFSTVDASHVRFPPGAITLDKK